MHILSTVYGSLYEHSMGYVLLVHCGFNLFFFTFARIFIKNSVYHHMDLGRDISSLASISANNDVYTNIVCCGLSAPSFLCMYQHKHAGRKREYCVFFSRVLNIMHACIYCVTKYEINLMGCRL